MRWMQDLGANTQFLQERKVKWRKFGRRIRSQWGKCHTWARLQPRRTPSALMRTYNELSGHWALACGNFAISVSSLFAIGGHGPSLLLTFLRLILTEAAPR